MRSTFWSFIVALGGLAGAVRLASAALLGITPGFPLTVFDGSGTLTYDATADTLRAEAIPIAIRFSPTLPPRFSAPTGLPPVALFSLGAEIDDLGALVGGVSGDDFVLVGEVDEDGNGTVDHAGTLLTGEVTEFGFRDSGGTTEFFDFRLSITGGSLSS